MKKILANVAFDVFSNYELSPDIINLELDEYSPDEFLKRLQEDGFYSDAVIFLSHALPRREAVWWACLCARKANISLINNNEKLALKAAEEWVMKPTELNRRNAEIFAEKTNYKSPSSWAATAAFWSGPSITKENEPPVPPPAFLYAHAVAGAVNISASLISDNDIKVTYLELINHGLSIADGGNG